LLAKSPKEKVKLLPYIRCLRLKNWLKNIFVFIPLVFAQKLTDTSALFATIITFIGFCFISSSVYVFNDICDIEKDAAHPVKCNRPIASGTISKRAATLLSLLCCIAGMTLCFWTGPYVLLFAVVYLAENIAYSLALKHMPIYDCFCIALGFVLRVYAGSFADTGIPVSNWLFLTVMAMSLFMAFGKRRGEMLRIDKDNRRIVLEHYDQTFLEGMIFICAGIAIVFYSLWSLDRGMHLIFTIPLVIFIVCKYLSLIHNNDSHGDPTSVILTDKTLIVACGVYVLLTICLLYSGPAA
jgi:4-hydroxybenzoate polyprenyltransferase